MSQRIVPEQPRSEPEILLPGDVRGRRLGTRTTRPGQRVYVARVGPFGFAFFILAITALTALGLLLLAGALVVVVPLVGLLLALAVGSSLVRGWLRRSG